MRLALHSGADLLMWGDVHPYHTWDEFKVLDYDVPDFTRINELVC